MNGACTRFGGRMAAEAVLLLCAAAGLARAAGEGVPVDGLRGIYVAPQAAAAERKALATLQRGLKALYGVELPAVPDVEGRVILLGAAPGVAAGLLTRQDLDRVAPVGCVIRTDGGRIAIAGPTAAATDYGVERFLDRLGYRCYADLNGFFRETAHRVAVPPDGRTIPALNFEHKPALIYRSAHSSARGEWADCSVLLREEVSGKTDQWIDHSAGYLVPKDLFYDAHPEYYAMTKEGKRVAREDFSYHRTPLCLSNPDVTRISVERALKWVERQPDRTFFPISYGDTGLWCQCPKCLALDPAPGQYAARVLQWVNPVARAIRAKAPDKIVVSFGYGGTGAPPADGVLEPNVHIMLAVPFAGYVCIDHARRLNALTNTLATLRGWQRLAPGRVGVCEYFSGVYYPSLVDHIQGVTRLYADFGINAIYFTYGRPRNFPGVWSTVYHALLADPALDAHALAREYVLNSYAPPEKARAILDFFELCRQRYQATLGDELDSPPRPYPTVITFYEAAFAERALAALERAGEKGEMKAFILNWMTHPVTRELDDGARALIVRQCERLLALAGADDKARGEALADIKRVGGLAERAQKGAGKVVADWLAAQVPAVPPAAKTGT